MYVSKPVKSIFQLEKTAFLVKPAHFCLHLPIDFFYFEDFRWSFFSKITGQKQQIPLPKINLLLKKEKR
jgi:hypothetical protein